MAPGEKFFLLLKIMGLQKLGLGLINQFQMAMILEAFVKTIVDSFVLVIHLIFMFSTPLAACWLFFLKLQFWLLCLKYFLL